MPGLYVPVSSVIIKDEDGNLIDSKVDTEGNVRLLVQSLSVAVPPSPPAAAQGFVVLNAGVVASSNTTNTIIPNGKVMHLQSLTIGSEGDPAEKNCKVTLFYWNGTIQEEITRAYTSSTTISIPLGDRSSTPSGVSMIGNGTRSLRITRTWFSGGSKEISAEVTGYYQ